MPHEVIEVQAPTLTQFMGNIANDPNDRVVVEGQPDSALRAIMFADIEGSTDTGRQDRTQCRRTG